MLFVFRLNRLNYIYYRFLSLFIKIKYYTKDENFLVQDNERFSILNDFDHADEFLSLLQSIHSDLKENLDISLFPRTLINILGQEVDFTKSSLQKFFIDFQFLMTFLYLTEKEMKKTGINRAIVYCPDVFFLCNSVVKGFKQKFEKQFKAKHQWHEPWLRFFHLLAKLFVTIPKSFLRPKVNLLMNFDTLISGLSESEMSPKPYHLKADWWTREKIFHKEKVLYLTPFPVNREGFIQENRLFGALSFFEKIACTKDILLSIIDLPFKNSVAHFYVQSSLDRLFLWGRLLPKMNIKNFITSNSESWPEPPLILLLNSHGIRTIRWSYSGAEYYFAKDLQNFKDVNLWSSFTLVKELWVWDEELKLVLEKRALDQIFQFEATLIKPILTMHNGDFQLLHKSRKELRQIMGVSDNSLFFISVFDARPVKRHRRISAGMGPINIVERQNAFHRDMIRILDSDKSIRIFYKPKRAKKTFHEDVEMANQLEKHPQVINCDVNLDPLIPILASDVVITVPMTSPTILAWGYDVPGIFYDPLVSSRYVASNKICSHILHYFDELNLYLKEQRKIVKSADENFEDYYKKMVRVLSQEFKEGNP